MDAPVLDSYISSQVFFIDHQATSLREGGIIMMLFFYFFVYLTIFYDLDNALPHSMGVGCRLIFFLTLDIPLSPVDIWPLLEYHPPK